MRTAEAVRSINEKAQGAKIGIKKAADCKEETKLDEGFKDRNCYKFGALGHMSWQKNYAQMGTKNLSG